MRNSEYKVKKIYGYLIILVAFITMSSVIWGMVGKNEDLKRLCPNIENYRFKPNFQSQNIDSVLNYYMMNTGITILKNPKITSNLTIISSSSVDGVSALNLLFKSLELSGLDAEVTDKFIVVDFKKPKESPKPIEIPLTSKVYELKYYSPAKLAEIVSFLLITAPEKAYGTKENTFPYLLVNATEAHQKKVEELVKALDVKPTASETKVFSLRWASANDLVYVLSTVLNNINKPVAVYSDLRTNSLVITGTNQDLAVAESLVKTLDIPTIVYDKATILQLKNSKVEDLVKLINQLVSR